MNSPYMPWLVLGGILLAALYLKGYVKLPETTSLPRGLPSPTDTILQAVQSRPSADDLVRHGSTALGMAFAKAKRLEAEEELAWEIAQKAGNDIQSQFKAPFSPPAPAGPSDPTQAGNPPSQ